MPAKKYQDRGFWLYTGTDGQLSRIKDEAQKRGLQPSKFIMAAVDEYITTSSRPRTSPEIQTLQEENNHLRKVLGDKELLLIQKDAELQELKGAAFLQDSWDADIDVDLLQALKSGPIHDHRLLDLLGATNPEAVQAISKQLQILETTGFIRRTSRGWQWQK